MNSKTVNHHGIKNGDIVTFSIEVADMRLWKRIIYFITLRGKPTITKHIVAKVGETITFN